MDHGGHSGHHMPSMGSQCNTQMLFNWQIEDTCVVFESWHIKDWFGMVLSCLAVIAITSSYESMKQKLALNDRRIAAFLSPPTTSAAQASSGRSSPDQDATTYPTGHVVGIPVRFRILRATGHAMTVFISFFVMLVFMTYNGYLILATVVGAGLGHYICNRDMEVDSVLRKAGSTSSLACH